MNIHEYQAKALLATYGVPVQPGAVAYTAAEAVEAARRLGGELWAVKAQIHAGGRGKAGGVKLVHSPEEAGTTAAAMLGTRLVTHQTGPQGRDVKRVYVEAASDIARELYLALSIDRATGVNPRRISMDLDQRAVGKLQQTLLLRFEHRLVLLESPGNFFE